MDHEPYERLLVEFPEYRARNKLAWTTTTSTSIDRIVLEKKLKGRKQAASAMALGMQLPVSENAVNEEAIRIEMELPRSFVYASAMEMLSRLNELSPLEAKDFIVKARAGGYKHAKTRLEPKLPRIVDAPVVVVQIDSSNETVDDIVHQHFEAPIAFQRVRSLRLHQLDDENRPPDGVVDHRFSAVQSSSRQLLEKRRSLRPSDCSSRSIRISDDMEETHPPGGLELQDQNE